MLAFLCCWQARESRTGRRCLFGLAGTLWALPGPLIGYGLKRLFDALMDVEAGLLPDGVRPLRGLLYEWPTPVPVLWAHVCRLFPFAVAVVWPAVRDVPRELTDSARADGCSPGARRGSSAGRRRGGRPPSRRSRSRCSPSARSAQSKPVQVYGRETFVAELFDQLHYGSTKTTAALCLVQLALAAVVAAPLLILLRRHGSSVA